MTGGSWFHGDLIRLGSRDHADEPLLAERRAMEFGLKPICRQMYEVLSERMIDASLADRACVEERLPLVRARVWSANHGL
jgi:hypothetical protein